MRINGKYKILTLLALPKVAFEWFAEPNILRPEHLAAYKNNNKKQQQ